MCMAKTMKMARCRIIMTTIYKMGIISPFMCEQCIHKHYSDIIFDDIYFHIIVQNSAKQTLDSRNLLLASLSLSLSFSIISDCNAMRAIKRLCVQSVYFVVITPWSTTSKLFAFVHSFFQFVTLSRVTFLIFTIKTHITASITWFIVTLCVILSLSSSEWAHTFLIWYEIISFFRH